MQYTLGDAAPVASAFAVDKTPHVAAAIEALRGLSVDSAVKLVSGQVSNAVMKGRSIVNSTDASHRSTQYITDYFYMISRAYAYYDALLASYQPKFIQAAPAYASMQAGFDQITKDVETIQNASWNPIEADAALALQLKKRDLLAAGNLDPKIFTAEEIAMYKAQAKAGQLQYFATLDPAAIARIADTKMFFGSISVKQVAIVAAIIGGYLLLRRRRA